MADLLLLSLVILSFQKLTLKHQDLWKSNNHLDHFLIMKEIALLEMQNMYFLIIEEMEQEHFQTQLELHLLKR